MDRQREDAGGQATARGGDRGGGVHRSRWHARHADAESAADGRRLRWARRRLQRDAARTRNAADAAANAGGSSTGAAATDAANAADAAAMAASGADAARDDAAGAGAAAALP